MTLAGRGDEWGRDGNVSVTSGLTALFAAASLMVRARFLDKQRNNGLSEPGLMTHDKVRRRSTVAKAERNMIDLGCWGCKQVVFRDTASAIDRSNYWIDLL